MSEKEIVRECIQEFLEEHAQEPFGILREAGVQADLRQRLLSRIEDYVEAEIRQPEGQARPFIWPPTVRTLRVQLEMKVGKADVTNDPSADARAYRADLVVLKGQGPVQLTCHPNGPGDIVAALRAQDIAVVVEVKASPSRTTEQKEKYAKDIRRLMGLNREHGLASFFIFLDKSQTLYGRIQEGQGGRWRCRTVEMEDWKELRRLLSVANNSTEKSIELGEVLPNNAKGCVEIWFINSIGRPQHVYAWQH